MESAEIIVRLTAIDKKLDDLNRNIVIFAEKTNNIYGAFVSYFDVRSELDTQEKLALVK